MILTKKLKWIDWSIVMILLLFMAISTLAIRSATYGSSVFQGMEIRQLINYALGFIVLAAATLTNYRLLVKNALYLYGLGIASLIGVYFFGSVINGARGWFQLPGFALQPAELMKLFLIIMVAYFLSRRGGDPLRLMQDVIPAGLIVFLPFLLVVIQPDLGNAIIYVVILLGMLWIANVRYIHVLVGVTLIASFIAGFVWLVTAYHDPIEQFLVENNAGHWMKRIDTFLYPEEASDDALYQQRNSKRAIGSGALFGEGYMQGDSVQKGFIPYTYSDSIFVVVGEEFGFLGSSILLLLYFLLIYRLILISIQCSDQSGAYMIIGIVSMFVFQIFQNIGMFLGILPLTGITLPFVSYGGSSLLINMLSIGLALSIRIHVDEPLDE